MNLKNHNNISETKDLEKRDKRILTELLKDRTTGQNIIWATSDYLNKYKDENLYGLCAQITKKAITGSNDKVVVPRYLKAKAEQQKRTKDKAEVFTPIAVCCLMNNYSDGQIFGNEDVFAKANYKQWKTNPKKIDFSKAKEKGLTWKSYIEKNVLEITGGEFPFLSSRYDPVSGEAIPVKDRIGLLDRKLRIIKENYMDEVIKSDYHPGKKEQWKAWAMEAVKHTYGYEWQGDNLLLGRENVLFTVIEHYQDVFEEDLTDNDYLVELAKVISWNLWQMDGLKFVIPMSCKEIEKKPFKKLFANTLDNIEKLPCPGCEEPNFIKGITKTTDDKKKGRSNIQGHSGIYCKIKNWDLEPEGHIIYFGQCLNTTTEEQDLQERKKQESKPKKVEPIKMGKLFDKIKVKEGK